MGRVTIKNKPGEKETVLDYALSDEKFDDDTDFDPEKTYHFPHFEPSNSSTRSFCRHDNE